MSGVGRRRRRIIVCRDTRDSVRIPTYGAGADSESHDVSDGGDGDGDAGVLHGERNLLLHRANVLVVLLEVAHALQDDEHVVDADA